MRRLRRGEGQPSNWANDRGLVAAAHRVLFNLGVLGAGHRPIRGADPAWPGTTAGSPNRCARLLLDYCAQAAATRAPATMKAIASHLAGFGRFLARLRPAGHRPGGVGPAHAHRTVAGLAGRRPASRRHARMSVGHRRGQILTVRQFLADITEWGWPAAPTRTLIFPRDIPRRRTRCRAICRRTPTGH